MRGPPVVAFGLILTWLELFLPPLPLGLLLLTVALLGLAARLVALALFFGASTRSMAFSAVRACLHPDDEADAAPPAASSRDASPAWRHAAACERLSSGSGCAAAMRPSEISSRAALSPTARSCSATQPGLM
jgi:hypothetical protein